TPVSVETIMSQYKLPSVSPLEAHLGFWMRFISNQASGNLDKLLKPHDISVSEWVVMRTLYQRDGVSHAELQFTLGMTKGATSKIVSRLEARVLIERRISQRSGRDQLLTLTADGNQLLPILAAIADKNDDLFFGHLPKKQRAELRQVLQALGLQHQIT
ncbi:MAG: MarR family winged helix-turn-helix transcriptional regulator, partial [Pseudohongiella sp.]|nr:MarR family winged helix-turn-helix transcriptional regulator [Pseudohongiella sp.]